MATKLQLVSDLYEQTTSQVTDNVDGWKEYLTTAARLYKYSFDDQLLIHAQRPDATACAFMEQWNGKMNRWVKAGSKGIALIHKSQGKPRLEYVFDVSDTRPVKGAKTPWLWEMREELHAPVLEKLEQLYGSAEGDDLGSRLMEIAARAVGETYRETLHDLEYDIGDSFLEGLDDLNLDVRFRDTLTASVQYILLTRCGLDASEYLEDDELRGITEFSTTTVLSHLGNACTGISSGLLQEIGRTIKEFDKENLQKPLAKSSVIDYTKDTEQFNALKRERSNQNGRIDIHEERGLSDSRHLDGRGGRNGANAAGQIWDAAADLFTGTPQGDVHLHADDRQTVAAPVGDRPDSADASGYDADRDEEAARRGREVESVQSDGVGAASEQPESNGGGNRPGGSNLQLNQEHETAGDEPAVFAPKEPGFRQISLFPTVEEQVENIAQAQAEEKQSPGRSPSGTFSFAPARSVSQEVIDRILASGGNEPNSLLRIVANLQNGATGSVHTSFVQKEYGTGGKGFKIDGKEYAVWFDADGLRVAPGRTTNVPGCTLIPWVQVMIRIRHLLQDGQYLTPEKLDAVAGNERREISAKLWYLRQDFSDEAREQGFMPHVSELYGGFPDSTKQIAELLESEKGREPFLTELAEFVAAYRDNPELLRFRRIHNPKELWARLADLGQKAEAFPTDPDFKPERPTFITNDELDHMLTRGSNVSESKMRIYSYFVQGHDLKERTKFLRNEYGIGGYGYIGYNENHDSKGISLTREDEASGFAGYDTVLLNWNRVDKRIGELIQSGRYMNQKELDYIPAYEKQELAQNIYHFYSGLPLDVERPFPSTKDYYDIKTIILPLLDNRAAMEDIHTKMVSTMAGIEPDSRHYAYNRRALDNVTAFMNGTYSLFTRLPDEVLQAGRQEKEAAKKQSKQAVEKAPVDELAAAARSLSRKKPTTTRETDNGQLSFDFAAINHSAEPMENTILPDNIPEEPDEEAAILAAHADVLREAVALLEERGIMADADGLFLDALEQLDTDSTAEEIADMVENIIQDDEQEIALSQYDLGYGHMGNGLTVWNEMETVDNDYKTIAHIAPDRAVTFYDDELPDIIREQIEQIAATSEMTISATQDAPVFSTLARQEPPTPEKSPADLYREAIPMLADVVRKSNLYDYLRDRETSPDEALEELRGELDTYMEEIVEEQPALYEAYTTLPQFKEWLAEDVFQRTYQDYVTDNRDSIAIHAADTDAPAWAKTAVDSPRVDAPEVPRTIDAQSKEPNLTPNVEEYLNLKAQHPDKVIGVQVGDLFLYYGKDAEAAAPALGRKIITREIPGLGETTVTGSPLGWQSDLVKLVERGNSVLFAGEDGAGSYEILKERTVAEYIPLGMELTIDGRRMQIDSVDFNAGTVSLRDLDIPNYPIFRSESVAFVRSYVEEQQWKTPEMEPSIMPNDKESPDLAKAKEPIPEDATEIQSEEAPAWVEIDGGEVGRVQRTVVDDPRLPYEVVFEKRSFEPERHNFHITDDDLGAGGQKTKYQYNVAAIRTLQAIEAEKRLATPSEQETLARYVGWGGIAEAFDPTRENWSKEYAELKELLTSEEYESARGSVLNAHYTSPTVINAIYKAVGRMNFQPGNILEPAMGVGNFFGLVPESMAASKLYGVELDSLTGRIAKQLYQKADITIAGFETTDRRDFYDLAIGNVPFGEYKVADRAYDKLGFSIHDYFLAKSLDQLRPGGIMAVVTSRYTMDKKGTEVRKYLAQKGDLLGAIRLPNNAFKANAGTDVVSDILFFQKRDRAPEREPDWVQTGKTVDDLNLNNYFLQHPDMVLGELTTKSTQYGHEELTIAPIPEAVLSNQLAEAVRHIAPPNRELLLTEVTETDSARPERASIPADPSVRNFSYTLVKGELYFRENSRMNPVEMGVTPAARVRGMVGLRDSARRLIDLQLQGAPDTEIDREQVRLNVLYDKFGKQYGLISSTANKLAFEQDSAYPLLCSLEIIDEDGKLERKADMFSKRTIQRPRAVESVDTASEALAVSIGEKACVDLGYMAQLMGGSDKIEQVVKDLRGVIFKDPTTGAFDFDGQWSDGWQNADEYLSGNVREKLAIARAAAETYPEFAINVERLEQIQPKDLTAAEIDVRIGATWIDPQYYSQFMFELLQTPRHLQGGKIDIRYAPITGEWNVQGKSEDSKNNARAYVTYGTKRINAYAIIENALNLRDTRIFDTKYEDGKEVRVLNAKETAIAQQKQEAIGEAFRDWIFKTPERREELCKTYNEIYNSTRPREYDGSHINYVGMNPEIHMLPHQSNAVAHMMYGHNTLLAHCVGAGKTFEMIAAALESKRLGLCQKSLVVVPNHLTEQWGGDFLRLYPGANVLVATKKDFEKANRKKFCARIATGDYDAVIIGHSQFEKIPLSAARQEAIIQDEISEIQDAIQDAKDNDGARYTIKQMEKSKKNLMARLTKLAADEKKDSVVTFEELGVDRLFVDEAHSFKNLFLHTKMRNVAGIGQSEAQKSTDMFGKCRYMDELTGGRGVVFATGTPVSNSMVELYTMMRYLQYDTLQKQGLGHFDSWAANFGEKVTAIELSPEGTGFRAKTRFAKFFNLPELMNLWKEAADIQTADMLKLPVPEAEYITVTTEPSEHQQAMVAELAERAKDVRDRKVEPTVDNMLRITGDGRKLALDQRLKNDLLPDDPGSKVNACVKNVFDVWEESTDIRGAQLVFCDLSTPHYDGSFNVYDDIKNKLMERGIPANEIAFIHDAKTETQKAELFAKVRKTQVRVLLGSTQMMGAGTNVQDWLVASHDLDCPWRPADLEQRAGRIIRRGNENKHVKMFKYVTKGTFDAYNWGLVENKQKFIGQIMTSKSPARSADDIDATALSYAEVKALATGDERFKEKMDLDIQVSKLKLLKSNHTAQQYEMEDKVAKYYPQKIKETELYIEAMTADLPVMEAHPIKEDAFSMTVMGTLYTERKDAGEAIIAACKTMTDPDQKLDLGEYRGFPMKLSLDGEKFKVSMKQKLTYTAELSNDPGGNITRINNALEVIPKNLEGKKEQLAALHTELDSAKEEAVRPFPKETEFAEKSARLNQLNIELDMTGKGQDGGEPEQEDEADEPREGGKPSILKALKQFDAPAPAPADRQRSYERGAAI